MIPELRARRGLMCGEHVDFYSRSSALAIRPGILMRNFLFAGKVD
jgi:hypothetical protein